jgi:hypothetical protein
MPYAALVAAIPLRKHHNFANATNNPNVADAKKLGGSGWLVGDAPDF